MLRTRLKSADHPAVGAEPFTDGLPFVASGVGPWDPEPDGGFLPNVLAARLLAFVSSTGVDQMGRSLMISVNGSAGSVQKSTPSCPARRAPRWSG